jgi:tripartite-type tricarboxylate transporter receptor subunit TctC
MFKKNLVLVFVAISLLAVSVQYSHGQKYPTKPIEILVGFSAGSDLTLMTRFVAETAEKYLGQPIVVINKPGAGATIAAADVIRSKPDGYKFMCIDNTFWVTTCNTQKVPFDPNDLVPLANFIQHKMGVFVKSDSPFKTYDDVVEYARKHPGELTWGFSYMGLLPSITTRIILENAGVTIKEMVYRGGDTEKIPALLGGHLDVSGHGFLAIKEQLRAGKVRCLLVNADMRVKEVPDVPNVVDIGATELKGINTYIGFGIHKDTPEEIKRTLFEALKKTAEDPEFRERFENYGFVLKFEGPEFVMESVKRGKEVIIPVLKKYGLYVKQ